jgi:capsular polysaccharide biosynthesis protein
MSEGGIVARPAVAPAGGRRLIPASLLAMATADVARESRARVHHVHSLRPATIAMPALTIGAAFFSRWQVKQVPAHMDWRDTSYESVAPAVFVLREACVHSSAGILSLDGSLLTETLAHTEPRRHFYSSTAEGFFQHEPRRERLSGSYISVLAGAGENYWHAMIAGVARLAALRADLFEAADGILFSSNAVGASSAVEHFGLPARLVRRAVYDDETLEVERLILPWSVHGEFNYHPCAGAFFDTVSRHVDAGGAAWPRLVYVDRRGTPARRLLNEDELISRLEKVGFTAIRLEELGFADQVSLFRGADIVVAPHGAGTTNIGYCRPGTAILEIFTDAHVNWCFRTLAALRGLLYDCVVGRDAGLSSVRAMVSGDWVVSVDHVMAGVDFLGK